MFDALELPEYGRWIVEALAFFLILAVPLLVVGVLLLGARAGRRPMAGAVRDTARDLAVPLTILLVIAFTLGPVSATQIEYPTNLIPFADVIGRLDGLVPHWNDAVDVVGNIALFVPFGAALAWRWPRARVRWVVLAAIGLSVAIEFTQAVTDAGRSASTTDVVTNAIGAALGLLVVRELSPESGRRATLQA
jgi:glycopeptide antibiotics resistance protein